jgi:rRNA maturation endonuclease Nob1
MAPKLALRNRKTLEQVTECACYNCYKIYDTKEVKDYTDMEETALCPYCGVDTVLPVNCHEDKNIQLLYDIHNYWIGKVYI